MKKIIVLIFISVLQLWAEGNEDCGCTGPRPPEIYLYQFPDPTLKGNKETMILNFCSYIGNRQYEDFVTVMPSFLRALKEFTGFCYTLSDPVIQSTFVCTNMKINMITYAVQRNMTRTMVNYLINEHGVDINGKDQDLCTVMDRIQQRLRYLRGLSDQGERTKNSIEIWEGYENFIRGRGGLTSTTCRSSW